MKAKSIAPARVLWSSVLLLALAVSALACSSGKKDNAATTQTTTGTTSSSSSAAATTTRASTSSGTTTAASTSRSTTSSGSSAAGSGAKIASLNSYKYEVKMEGFGGPLADFGDAFGGMTATPAPNQSVTFQITGAYIKPDKAQMTITLPGFSFGQTIIGTQEWVDFGGFKQGPTPTTEKAADLSLAAAFWDEADLADAVGKFSCDSSRSSINGVQARKCGVDKATYEVLKSQLGGFFDDSEIKDLTRFSLEAWLTDAGIPVRVLIDMAGKDATNANFSLKLTMNLTDINGNFEIKAP